jgi:protein-S-isoprenylcysteine O-methyltransferase Ste14
MRAAASSAPVSVWRHLRAIALLPFMNTVVIPAAILYATHGLEGAAPPSAAAAIGGVAALAAGLALAASSITLFVRVGEGTLAPWDPARVLVEQGVYRYSRNPMKSGLVLVLLAEALLLGSWPLFAWFLLFTTVNAVYIRVYEEPNLRARHGAPYREYCSRVPRWFPRLPLHGSGERDVARGSRP